MENLDRLLLESKKRYQISKKFKSYIDRLLNDYRNTSYIDVSKLIKAGRNDYSSIAHLDKSGIYIFLLNNCPVYVGVGRLHHPSKTGQTEIRM